MGPDSKDDIDNIVEWQKNKDPNKLTELLTRYNPLIYSVTNAYKTSGINPISLRTQARSQLIKGLSTFKPDAGAAPITHLYNSLLKIRRVANKSLLSGSIPENRALKRSSFMTIKSNLEDSLGREPNLDEMADALHWSKSEVSRMENELGTEITASGNKFDFLGNSTVSESKDKAITDMLYSDLHGPDKFIFQHTFGYENQPILSNKDIAKKLHVNEMAVHRSKKRIADRIRSYR